MAGYDWNLRYDHLEDSYLGRNIISFLRILYGDRTTAFFTTLMTGLILLAIFGPALAPHEYDESVYKDGQLWNNQEPTLEHPLGTDRLGRDLLSRLIYGARPTMISGLLGGSLIILIGSTMGIVSGYVGGRVDNILMRFTDIIYGVPLLPFAIVLVALFGADYIMSIFIIAAVLWRGSARVIRSQVLQIRERPFIMAAKATGSSTPRIIIKHILPNIAPLAFLFFALGVRATILVQAGLSFLGIGNPFLPSWGVMIRNAFVSGAFATDPWWSIPPGIMISLAVLSAFMMGRGYEERIKDKELAEKGFTGAA